MRIVVAFTCKNGSPMSAARAWRRGVEVKRGFGYVRGGVAQEPPPEAKRELTVFHLRCFHPKSPGHAVVGQAR